jgi:hypothetical protein
MVLHHDERGVNGEVGREVAEAIGKASEAFEYVERARGHLYGFHQLIGRADLLFGEAADLLARAGAPDHADELASEIVGRNVLDGRWTFQVVDEFDDLYYRPAGDMLRRLENELQGGRRHVHESRLKEERRSRGRAGHERQPPTSHSPGVDTER